MNQMSFAELRAVVYQAYRPRRTALLEEELSEQGLHQMFMRCKSVGQGKGEPLADISKLARQEAVQRAVHTAVRTLEQNHIRVDER
jgi:hypothetical protein